VDWFASLLSLDREDVAPPGDVVVLPYLDGERTPNLPGASGLVLGLRHDTPPAAVLQAAYDGAAVSLLAAFAAIAAAGGEVDPAAPVIAIGGGARGQAWRRTLARLSGRAIAAPEAGELVALGAAAQAAALLTDAGPAEVARTWQLGGAVTEPPGEPDLARVAQVEAALVAAGPLLRGA
jgi:xylulokinase